MSTVFLNTLRDDITEAGSFTVNKIKYYGIKILLCSCIFRMISPANSNRSV